MKNQRFAAPFRYAVLACLLPLPLLAQPLPVQVTGGRVTEVGIYSSRVITDQTNSAGLKFTGLDQFALLTSTTNIPARIGTRFGFRYEIFGQPTNAPIVITMVTQHPPLTNAATGRFETTDRYNLKSQIGPSYTACSLDEPADCTPGTWTFEVWYQEQKLCTQSFLVVPEAGH